ncbi:hypothetical protein GQR58_008620 [Nymphon striatum]|nr:hypothetical protein GQR58_008620 [Nymphon striatum]
MLNLKAVEGLTANQKQKTNEWVLDKMENPENLLTTISRSKMSFVGHIFRSNDIGKDLLMGTVYGNRGRDNKTRYSDNIKEIGGGRSFVALCRMAQDRVSWRATAVQFEPTARLVLKRLRLQQLRRKKLREINAKATTTRRDCNSRLHPMLINEESRKGSEAVYQPWITSIQSQSNIRDAESAERWRRQLEENTKVTWRLNAGKYAKGKVNIYKRYFRCQHNTHPRSSTADSRRIQDPLPELPGLVEFKYCHNHELISANSLKERDVSDEAKQKLQELFQNDHSPSSALEAFKIDLEFSEGENYDIDAADGAHLPDAGYCYSESLNTVKIKYEPVQSMNESDEEVDGTSHAEENWLSFEVKKQVKDESTKLFQPDDKSGNMGITEDNFKNSLITYF